MNKLYISILLFLFLIISCSKVEDTKTLREMKDTVGFAQYNWQMDSIISRINKTQKTNITKNREENLCWKTVISPHDDYSYVGSLYPKLLQNISAKTIFIFGVAHKARYFNLENKIIFDSYKYWHAPFGKIKISSTREKIIEQLPQNYYVVHDSMQKIEHSVEALLPFIQYFNPNIEIVSILVPYMPYNKMVEIAQPLAMAINKIAQNNKWEWGKDYAIAISSDAVHYGDEGWSGKNYAKFGADKEGLKKAVAFENKIIEKCLAGEILPDKIKKFTTITVEENNFKKYKWTWCGRYSVPFGLLTSYYLQNLENRKLVGEKVGYANSIDHPHIKVSDLKMGVTAPANIHHWVGYPAIGYK